MSAPAVLANVHWRRSKSVELAALLAPRAPGIYAYAECRSVHGLPSKNQWIYVGKAKRLDLRLGQHDAGRERYAALRDWLHGHHGDGEVWYAAISAEHLDLVERDLICELSPLLNRVRYKSHRAA